MSKSKIFMPGEVITTEEEYSAGKNTFLEFGKVKASSFGEAKFDDNSREVSIEGKEIKPLENGDIVFGRILMMKDSVAVVDIIKSENKRVMTITRGQIPAKFAAKKFVTNIKDLFKIGDYIKARVVSANDLAVDLATNETGLGVITAYCSNCKKELKSSNDKMICFACGHSEGRKWFEQEDKFEPREGGFRNHRRGNDRRGNFHGNDRRGNFNRSDRRDDRRGSFNRNDRGNDNRERSNYGAGRNNFNQRQNFRGQ